MTISKMYGTAVKNFHFMTMLNTSISMRKLQIQ